MAVAREACAVQKLVQRFVRNADKDPGRVVWFEGRREVTETGYVGAADGQCFCDVWVQGGQVWERCDATSPQRRLTRGQVVLGEQSRKVHTEQR